MSIKRFWSHFPAQPVTPVKLKRPWCSCREGVGGSRPGTVHQSAAAGHAWRCHAYRNGTNADRRIDKRRGTGANSAGTREMFSRRPVL